MDAKSERVALVTGAARGIGAATVHRLVAAGYRVMAVDSTDVDRPPGVDYALASAADLEAIGRTHGDRVITRTLDVRDLDALKSAAAATVAEFGRIDAAIACAAVIVGGRPLWETPAEHLQTLLDVDVVGVWNTAAATVPYMLASQDPSGCRFVAVSSAAADHGLHLLAGYNAAKHAVVGIVRGLAADLVGTGVSAVAVSPGSTDTDMLRATAALYGVQVEDLTASQLVRRALTPDEIATVIELCCAAAGVALNGSVVSATGGFQG